MSGFRVHMLVGAVGGLALVTGLRNYAPEILAGILPGQPVMITQTGIIVGSALAAIWPDIDTSESLISHHVVLVLTSLGVLCGVVVAASVVLAEAARLGLWWGAVFALGLLGGAAAGRIVAKVLLTTIRIGMGGHRAGTHSLYMAAALLLLASVLNTAGLRVWASAPLVLFWGWALHVCADVPTPMGWRPLPGLPLVVRLPKLIARHGETLTAFLAVLSAAALLRWG